LYCNNHWITESRFEKQLLDSLKEELKFELKLGRSLTDSSMHDSAAVGGSPVVARIYARE